MKPIVWRYVKLIILLCRIYNMSEDYICDSLNSSSAIRQFFPITSQERLVYEIVGSFDIVLAVISLILLSKVESLKEPPSEILIIMSIYTIVKTLLIYIALIYNDIEGPNVSEENFYSFCQATGLIQICARSAKLIYTLFLTCLYAYRVKNPLQAWTTLNKEIHLLCIFGMLLISFILYFSGFLGMTIYGYCGLQFTPSIAYIQASSDFAYAFALAITSFYFLRNVRYVSTNNKIIKEYFVYYLIFIVAISTNQILLATGQMLIAVACSRGLDESYIKANKILVNVCNSSLSFFIVFVIFFNPQFRRLAFRKIFGDFYQESKNKIKRRLQNKSRISETFYDDLFATNRKTIMLELIVMSTLQKGYLSNLKEKSRACFLASILGCLSLQHYELNNHQISEDNYRSSAVEDESDSIFGWSYEQKYSFNLTQQIVDHYDFIFSPDIPTVCINFTLNCPNILFKFAQNNKQKNIWKSLSPINNKSAIAKDCGVDGGSSGQFFFFNENKTLLLKTISNGERKVFLDRIKQFHHHFTQNSQSLLVKPYAIVTALNNESKQQVGFVLMGNLLKGIDKKYVLRTYDLKGSSYSRQVLKDYDFQENKKINQTLKDIDFLVLEQKIKISEESSEKLKQIIKRDSLFLMDLGLIDYSLLLVKLDLAAIRETEEQMKKLQEIVFYQNINDNTCYVVGIIDYLQTWNLRKKSQKWYKSFFIDKKQISSQNPKFYSQRFILFSELIL